MSVSDRPAQILVHLERLAEECEQLRDLARGLGDERPRELIDRTRRVREELASIVAKTDDSDLVAPRGFRGEVRELAVRSEVALEALLGEEAS
jgi:hypothetical protein